MEEREREKIFTEAPLRQVISHAGSIVMVHAPREDYEYFTYFLI